MDDERTLLKRLDRASRTLNEYMISFYKARQLKMIANKSTNVRKF